MEFVYIRTKLTGSICAVRRAFSAAPGVALLLNTWMVIGVGAAESRPNILFISVDDLRPEIGAYGATVKTPNFDRLAASGMRFDRAYCQQAVCGASRLSIMSGLYPTVTGEQSFHVNGWRKRHPNLITMNQHFGTNGYNTIGVGKIYHDSRGPGGDRDSWKQWISIGVSQYALPENLELEQAAQQQNKGGAHDPPKGPTTEMADVPDDTYRDGKIARRTSDMLRQLARSPDSPFFLAVGFTKPHLPFVAPKKYWDLYQRSDFAMPSNAGIPPGYPRDAANPIANEMQMYSDYEGKAPTYFSDEMNRRLLHGYAACVSYTDANIGVILDTLKTTGLDKNTIVVLWGDHGWKLGDHSSWCKHTNFECDTRVPLIVRAPGKKTGVASSRLVELIDLFPTLCHAARIPTPAHCQGRSFLKLLDDPETGHRRTAYSSYPAHNTIGHSIRFSKYRYTEWRLNEDTDKVSHRVLTDLAADPGEVTNVIDDPAHSEALQD
ncbi:MAG: iduronate 2-sulfatase, partial [Rhodothermales bacterium]